MFYHPHFCCHCGEKIARAKWTPMTSRRFCDFCAIEQKQHDLIPRAAAVLLLLFGAAGFTAYLSGGQAVKISDTSQASRIGGLKSRPAQKEAGLNAAAGLTNTSGTPKGIQDESESNTNAPEKKQRVAPRNSSTEPVFYCGAMTKKGTACTRRVKAPGRCWQHLGQPAASLSQN
ncbi:MAG TPA: hypothetical protein VMZ26_17065 [Pyrinomonadaceae bacterium]|nr:hypothetical protein [Pyrinomonadaceae bacterium]